MQSFLSQCGNFSGSEYPLLLSVFLAGLIGSLTHCSLMCSPAVMAQMLQASHTPHYKRGIVFYHFGRITTYALLGILAVISTRFVFGTGLKAWMNIFIIIAGFVFIISAFAPKKTHHCCKGTTTKIGRFIDKHVTGYTLYYFRGLLMGFIPCGMIISILLIASTSAHIIDAALLMVVFGLSTIPALQTVSFFILSAGKPLNKQKQSIGQWMMAINGLFLCSIGLRLVQIH